MDGKGEAAGRVPPAFDGIQVNFCKNPACGNFSVPADERSQKTGRGERSERKDRYFLRQQLASTEKLRFYCDQESGLRAAVMAVFSDRILEKRCAAFYVRIAKELINPQKLALYNRSIADLQELPGLRRGGRS